MATTKLGDVYPIIIDKYESFVPLNGGVDMIEKINSVVEHLNRLGQLTTETVNQWNKVMKWVNADGLTDSVNAKIDDLIAKGLFDELLNGMMDDLNSANTTFQNTINSQETAFQNTINSSLATKANQSALDTTNANVSANTTALAERAKKYRVDVTDSPYNAKGDGIVDDSTAIQSAINYVASKFGGEVYLPKGTYKLLTEISIPNVPITIIGDGWTTVLKASASITSVLHKGIGVVSGIKIKNMEIDGNLLANYSIWLEQGTFTEISGVHLKNFKEAGFYSNTTATGLAGAVQYETQFNNSKITGLVSGFSDPVNRPNYGIYMGSGATDSHFHDVVIRNVKIAHISDQGGNNMYSRIHMFGFPVPDMNAQYGIDLVNGRTYLNQIYCDGLQIGVKARGGFFNLTNSVFYWDFGNIYSGMENFTGVEVDATCTDYVISNNIFRGQVGYDVKLLGTTSGSVFGNTSISVINKITQFHRPKVIFDNIDTGYGSVGGKEILHKGNRPSKIESVNSAWTLGPFTVALSTSQTQPDTNYHVLLTMGWNAGAVWVTNKTTTGFTVNYEKIPTTGIQPFVWELVRP
jgi:hypothetical protein